MKAETRALNAIEQLTADHDAVRELFGRYADLAAQGAAGEDRAALAARIRFALMVHAQLEEEVFYPGVRDAVEDVEMLFEARVEHDVAEELIARIDSTDPDDELYDASVKVLGEYVKHHIEAEEGGLFPAVEASDLDLDELGEAMAERRGEVEQELAEAQE